MSEDCPYCVFEKTEANCPGCFEGSHYRPKPITNADRIRSMSDEEFSHFLFGIQCAPASRPKEWLDWLRQEAKE